MEPPRQRKVLKGVTFLGSVAREPRDELEELTRKEGLLVDYRNRGVQAEKVRNPITFRFREIYVVTEGFERYAFQHSPEGANAYEAVTKREEIEGTDGSFVITLQYWHVNNRKFLKTDAQLEGEEVDLTRFDDINLGYEDREISYTTDPAN